MTLTIGSIPAYAGDPPLSGCRIAVFEVYPRLRGGSIVSKPPQFELVGLSPPTRGILIGKRVKHADVGSIPAYAGDPHPQSGRRCQGKVYPRLRGGSGYGSIAQGVNQGLSPPTRGIHIQLL